MFTFRGKQYKDKARFTAIARCSVERHPSSFVAQASIKELKTLLPATVTKNPDLLSIAGNLFVANLINGNGDSISTEDTLLLYPTLENKYINLEHDQEKIIGHIKNVRLTKFDAGYKLGTGSEVLTDDDVKDSSDPFNVAIGGFIYSEMFPSVASRVEESNDPESAAYLTVAFSWEVAFDKWNLLVGSKDMSKAEVITDQAQIDLWTPFLRTKEGSGVLPDGRTVARQIVWARKEDGSIDENSMYALGAALTLSPAGQVKGVVTESYTEREDTLATLLSNVENNISNPTKDCVTANTNKTMKVLKTINDVKALNDESAKEYSFANIGNVLEAALQDSIEATVKQHDAAMAAKVLEVNESVAKAAQTAKDLDEVKTNYAKLEAELSSLRAEQQKAEAAQVFNNRMSYFDGKFELGDADRKVIARRINGLSEDDFNTIAKEELEVLLSSKDKVAVAALKKQSATASQIETPATQVAQDALETAKATEVAIPNTSTQTQTLEDKYKNAFSLENITSK